MEQIERYKEVFEKARNIVEWSKSLIKPGVKILEVAESIEKKILEVGAKPAFPVNIGINDVAAHYTPTIDDEIIIRENDLVKVDIGLHIDGYIADFAYSFSTNKEDLKMIEVAKSAVKEAGKIIKEGTKIREISEVIENFVSKSEYKIVRNLTGHFLDRYVVHGISIPNIRNDINIELKKGQALAIEVFVTNGDGWVKESNFSEIFQYNKDVGLRNMDAKKILDMSKKDFEKLPFAKRWIKNFSTQRIELAIKELLEKGALISYPILKEISNSKVAQWEESFIVD
ncbi:MAG: type II methionyl aminopeptidase [Candidatus Aenigmatarchaeota archaeon]